MELNIDNVKIEKKRGRKKKEVKDHEEAAGVDQQSKYFIDLSKDSESLEVIKKVLKEANRKSYGREIILKDLVIALLPKVNQKDIERIQEQSLTEMERVQRHLDEFNEKNTSSLSLGEFLVKKFNL